jgi:TPR repeat protein
MYFRKSAVDGNFRTGHRSTITILTYAFVFTIFVSISITNKWKMTAMQLLSRYVTFMGIVVAFLCSCAVSGWTNADATSTFEDGIQALESEDYQAAYEILKMHAERGDPRSLFSLGMIYMLGLGVTEDHEKAASWFQKAAELGMPEAQFQLGAQYYRGMGLSQDYNEAVRWYRKAAEQGFVDAQSNLGVLYLWGHGVPQDYSEAARWYRKAAEQGHTAAQVNLAQLYQCGLGVPQDYKAALDFHRKVAGESMAEAMAASAKNLAMSYHNVNMMVQLLPIAGTRDTAQTPAIMVGPDNTDVRRSEQEFYLSVYDSVIHSRGYESIAGSYKAESTPSCEHTHGSWAIGMQGDILAELTITQDGPEVLMMHRYESDDSSFNIDVPGTIAEDALVFTDPMNSDYSYVGDIVGSRITVRPDVDRIYAAWPEWLLKKPSRDDLSNCIITITRMQNSTHDSASQ